MTSIQPVMRRMTTSAREQVNAKPAKKRFDWVHYIELGGVEGRDWIERYRQAGGMELTRSTERALDLLRRRQLDRARELLADIDREILSLGMDGDDSIKHVMRRWYNTALAYELYCHESFTAAAWTLDAAHEAVIMAVETCGFLLPLAAHCCELRIQHARIARIQRRWKEMWEHIQTAKSMLAGERPLCILSDGTAVRYAEIAGLYGPLKDYDAEDRKSLVALLEAKYRVLYFERHLHWVYTPAGFVIPYTSLLDEGQFL